VIRDRKRSEKRKKTEIDLFKKNVRRT